MKEAKEKGIYISFDPNFRDNLWWDRLKEFVEISLKCIEKADFIKLSDEELKIITGCGEVKNGVKALSAGNDKVIAVTLGSEGTLVAKKGNMEIIKSIKIKSIDSTGAGDAFVGAILYKLSLAENAKEAAKDFDKVKEIVSFANKVGALVCTKLGAISAIPTLEEVERF